MTRRNKDVGDWGEQQACIFLQRHGFRIVERNYYTTMGEIDVIAVKGNDFYFIEVKTRHSTELAADDSITYIKKIRLKKAVRAYCFVRNIVDAGIILAGLIIEIKTFEKTLGIRFYAIA